MARKLYNAHKGQGIGAGEDNSRGHVRLDCGCLGWSRNRPDLIVCFCAAHEAQNRKEFEAIKECARAREAELSNYRFGNAQVLRNVDRLRDFR